MPHRPHSRGPVRFLSKIRWSDCGRMLSLAGVKALSGLSTRGTLAPPFAPAQSPESVMGGRVRAPGWPRWNHSFASIAETQRELNPELSLTHTNGPSAERCRRTEQSAEGVSLVRSGAYVTTTDSRERSRQDTGPVDVVVHRPGADPHADRSRCGGIGVRRTVTAGSSAGRWCRCSRISAVVCCLSCWHPDRPGSARIPG